MEVSLIDLTPLAQLVLEQHAGRPETVFYAFEALGSAAGENDFRRLDQAYQELEERGLMARTKHVVTFFGHSARLHQLTPLGRDLAREAAA